MIFGDFLLIFGDFWRILAMDRTLFVLFEKEDADNSVREIEGISFCAQFLRRRRVRVDSGDLFWLFFGDVWLFFDDFLTIFGDFLVIFLRFFVDFCCFFFQKTKRFFKVLAFFCLAKL